MKKRIFSVLLALVLVCASLVMITGRVGAFGDYDGDYDYGGDWGGDSDWGNDNDYDYDWGDSDSDWGSCGNIIYWGGSGAARLRAAVPASSARSSSWRSSWS